LAFPGQIGFERDGVRGNKVLGHYKIVSKGDGEGLLIFQNTKVLQYNKIAKDL